MNARIALFATVLLYASSAFAAEQHAKAIWEPINYAADVELNDVFFVTDREGWIAGGKNTNGGVLLHTTDGGDHWELQAGDPESSEKPFRQLRFIDATHGWAVQRTAMDERLLHTTDAVNWIAVGKLPLYSQDYQFTSDKDGVVATRDVLSATHDGGRTWAVRYKCRAQIEVDGLTRNTTCDFVRIQFLTPQTGYAIGHSAGKPLDVVFVVRTDDGGDTWNLITAPVTGLAADAFFIDANTGYLQTGRPASGLLFKTTDGGASWKGLVGSPGEAIKFADPDVGWAIYERKVSFTLDGGNRWNSRTYAFPTVVKAFSLPRRDRGYVVGAHGMIYRYRLVPAEFAVKGMIAAAALEPIDFTVPNELQKLSAQAQTLEAAVAAPAKTTEATTSVPPAVIAPMENTLSAVAAQTPAFVSRYRNLNLLMVGMQMMSTLPQQIVELKQSLVLAKTSKDATARAAAVGDFSTKLQGVITFMNTNFHSPLLAKKNAAQ